MSDFEPELGQMLFGQPTQQFAVSELWIAALDRLNTEIERVTRNETQREVWGPMRNSGETFDCETFSAHAYSWSDDEQPWNFKWRDVRISWYKYLGRGTSANRKLTAEEAGKMLDECLKSLEAR